MSLFNQYLWSLILILAKIKIFKWGNNKSQFKHREDFRVFWKFISGNFLRSNIIKREKNLFYNESLQAKSFVWLEKINISLKELLICHFIATPIISTFALYGHQGSAILLLIVIMATKENDGHGLWRYPFTPDCHPNNFSCSGNLYCNGSPSKNPDVKTSLVAKNEW